MQYFTEIALQKSDFPFDTAVTAGETVYPQQEEYVHNHDCLELIQVLHEGGYLLYDGSKYPLCRGDVWIINNRDYHMAFSTGELQIRVIVFDTDLVWNTGGMDHEYLKAFFDRRRDTVPVLCAEAVEEYGIDRCIEAIGQEWREKLPGYRVMIRAELLKLLGLIYRCYEKNDRFSSAPPQRWRSYHALLPVIDLIDSNLQQCPSPAEAAAMAHMSESYFAAEFRRITQLPFSRYVLEKRVQRACILLTTTRLSITEIALQCGFNTISYFNRTFKSRLGLSPGEYRSRQKKAE
ncbi:MAG: helix-turn-helix domain-containing protein [Oscillospiraceae bacterium]|nr:helix-turn-helix domain-containing protein [Oscillospiraceae bacterium]